MILVNDKGGNFMEDCGATFVLVPNDLIIKGSEYELITYISLSMNRQLFDVKKASISIVNICQTMKYSFIDRRKGSYYMSIRKILEQFCERGWIKPYHTDDKKVNPSELMVIELNRFFFPEKNYTSISMQELNDIINCTEYKSKASLIKVFLYIKSFMQMVYKGHTDCVISAYYVVGNVAARALNMSRSKYDACINALCNIGLLICHQTGSYFTQYGITNAPNIYVLANEDATRNISGALNRLKYNLLDDRYGNGEDFMPITHVGKPFQRADDSDDGEWGDPNPMNRYYIKGEN